MKKLFKNIKIGKKLQLTFGAIIVIFILTIMVAVTCILMINSKMEDFYHRPYVNSVAQMKINRDIQYIEKQILWSMTTEDLTEVDSRLDEADKYTQEVTDNLEELTSNSRNQELMKELNTAISQMREQRAAVVELAAENKNAEALEIFNGVYTDTANQVQEILSQVGSYQDEVALQAYSSADSLGKAAAVIMFAIGAACILFCVYIGLLITKSIQAPVLELEAAARKLSGGELDVQIEYESKDELGSLADNFRTAFYFMREVISDASHLLDEIAKGNFQVEFTKKEKYVGDFVNIVNSLISLVEKLDGTLKQINEGSVQVAEGSGQMALSAQSLAEGATEQAGAVEELTATVENVNTMAQESLRNAESAYEKTHEAEMEAQSGKTSMNELVKAMENISSVSKEIQNIIGAIEDIASQTNLLSLNASIEAARAGEAGRGFAVVADQIGKLAADSAQSAVETRELIIKSLEEIEHGNHTTQETVKILENIINSIGFFAETAKSSSEASQAQADMLAQLQEGISQIAGVIQSNSAAAEESSATSEELSAQSDNLKALVEQFRLRN